MKLPIFLLMVMSASAQAEVTASNCIPQMENAFQWIAHLSFAKDAIQSNLDDYEKNLKKVLVNLKHGKSNELIYNHFQREINFHKSYYVGAPIARCAEANLNFKGSVVSQYKTAYSALEQVKKIRKAIQ